MQTNLTGKDRRAMNQRLRTDGFKTGFKSNVLRRINWQAQLKQTVVTPEERPYVKRFLHAASLGWFVQKVVIASILLISMLALISFPKYAQQHTDYQIYTYQVQYAKTHHQTKLLNTTLKDAPQAAWFVKFGHINRAQYLDMIGEK